MPDYQISKIYTIKSKIDPNLIYVGSTTCKYLCDRMAKHRHDCKREKPVSLYKHIENNDWTNWYIELYEHYPCTSKDELLKREGQVTLEIGTINQVIAGRNKQEREEANPEYYKELHHTYYMKAKEKEGFKEKSSERRIKWIETNKEHKKQSDKEYKEKNKERIKEHKSKKVTCECGSVICHDGLSLHRKSKKHIAFITHTPNN
jgi:hypothetical protein